MPLLPLDIRLLVLDDVSVLSGSLECDLRVEIAALQLIQQEALGRILFNETDAVTRKCLEEIFCRVMLIGTLQSIAGGTLAHFETFSSVKTTQQVWQ